MSTHIGANQALGIAKETTRGTAVTANIMWIPKASGTLNPEDEYINDESGIGTIVTVRDSRKIKAGSNLSCEVVMGDISIGQLLMGVFGDEPVSVVDGLDAGVYNHTYELAENNTHQSFTIYANDNVIGAGNSERATYGVVDSFEINATAGDYVRTNLTMIGRGVTEVAHQATSFLTENKFSFDDVSIKVVSAANKAAAITALASAPAFKVQSLRVNFAKNTMQNQELGSLDIADIFNQNFTIEGDFTAVYKDKDIYDVFNSSSKKYLQIIIQNQNVTIGTISNPTLDILLNQVSFQTWTKSSDINAIVTQTIGFIGEFNTTDGEAVTAVLKNTKTSY